MLVVNDIPSLAKEVLNAYANHNKKTVFTVVISGIDASGKGYITKLLQQNLESNAYKVANINIDPWQNPIPVRLRNENPAENIYENIFRWNDFFEQLIFPLQKNKGIYLETMGIRSDADIYEPLAYDFRDLDILLIDGILLLKKKYLSYYDYKIWIDCSFETGLKRALERNVERLDVERLMHDYHTFYYAAQRLHLLKDEPLATVDLIFMND